MARRQGIRAAVLQVLHVGRPIGCSETLIAETIERSGEYGTLGPQELRREMDYLEDKGLIRVQGRTEPVWFAEITGYGVDVVEGAVPCPDGIARIRYD